MGSRHLSRNVRLPTAGLIALITLASAAPARALPADPEELVTAAPAAAAAADKVDDRAQPYVLPRVMTASPGPPALFVLSSGGYGYTESVLGAADSHHRVAGSLMVDGRPLRWLGLALRLDGRYDKHVIPGQPGDAGLVGDPRFYVRVDRALGPALAIGARAGVWLPGRNAPSLDLGALSPELLGAVSYFPGEGRVVLSANLGYRLDRSARTATDAPLLGPGDRLALGVSAYDSVLVGGSAGVRLGRAHVFVEGSWNMLVGAGSPRALASPIRVGGGVRLPLGPRLGLEALAEVSPSARPDLSDPMSPLVPVPPRFAVGLGLAYRFAGAVTPAGSAVLVASPAAPTEPVTPPPPAAPTEPVTPEPDPAAEPKVDEAPPPPRGQLRGIVRSFRGSAVDADVNVDGVDKDLRAEQGRFELDVTPGVHEVRISARGYTTQVRRVRVEENGVTLLNIDLKKAP